MSVDYALIIVGRQSTASNHGAVLQWWATATEHTYNVSNGSGCGSVDRVVASNARVPRFESNHRQFFKNTYLLTVNCTGKAKIKKKRPGMAHLKKQWQVNEE